MTRSTVSPEIKAAALADLASGEQPAIVAKKYGINAATVRSWKNRDEYIPDATADATKYAPPHATLIRRPSIEEHQTRILDLMYQNLAAKLTASQRIAEHATHPDWLHRQSAEGVAALGQYLDATAINTLALLAGRKPDEGDT